MIQSIAHVTVYVLNQDEALDFYQNKLGFEVGTDMTVDGGFRWLTVFAKAQPDLELVLAEPKEGPMFTKDAADKIRALVADGAFGVQRHKMRIVHRDGLQRIHPVGQVNPVRNGITILGIDPGCPG